MARRLLDHPGRALVLAMLAVAAVIWACGETSVEPPTFTQIEVTSPIGRYLDVGGGAQLSALAKRSDGGTASGVTFTWSSSNPGVVSVGASGSIEALAVGSATIWAEADGVRGSLGVVVVDADLEGISALAKDPFVSALIAATSSDLRSRLGSAMGTCVSAVGQGNLEALDYYIADVRAEVTGATNPDDRALVAVLALFVDEMERCLNM